MAYTESAKYMAIVRRGQKEYMVGANTKTELQRVFRSYPDIFSKGKKVLIIRQKLHASGPNKYITVGKSWMLPHSGDDDLSKEIAREAKEYFKRHRG